MMTLKMPFKTKTYCMSLVLDIEAIDQMIVDMLYLKESEEDEIYELQAQSIIDSLNAYKLMKRELLETLTGERAAK